MRTLENQLEGLHEERGEHQRQELIEEDQREDEIPVRFGEDAVDQAVEQRGVLIHAIAAILDDRHLTVSGLGLPQQEANALECLQAAVEGREVNGGNFVFAEDRANMLELALAVLQPNLSASDQVALSAGLLPQLTQKVAALRQSLKGLEDAQDELIVEAEQVAKTETPDETDGDTALDGPERPAKPKPKSTLDGPGIAEPPAPKSTLDGPAVREEPKPKSTLDGPAVPEAGKPKSTLS